MKKVKRLRVENMTRCLGCYSCMMACARHIHKNFSPQKSAVQIRTKGGLQSKFVANICRSCKNPACVEACSSGALLTRLGGGATFKKDNCTSCGLCVASCPVKAISWDTEKAKPIICLHCGLCTKYCPHQCLQIEEVEVYAN